MFKTAEEVIDEIGMPTPPKSRGRPRGYDWKQILAALICKPGFRRPGAYGKWGYCKVGCSTPCDSELHYVYSQIPEEWLDKALEHLDDKVTALYAKFNEFLNEFVVDGTGT